MPHNTQSFHRAFWPGTPSRCTNLHREDCTPEETFQETCGHCARIFGSGQHLSVPIQNGFWHVSFSYLLTPYLSERASEYRKNRVLFELKAQYFTKLYANSDKINNDINISNENWDFSVNKYFLIFKDLFAQTFLKAQNTIHIDENNNSDEIINLNFIINGIDEKKFECKKNELTEDVIKKFLKDIGKEEKPENFLFIFGLRRLILEITIGENGLRDNHYITMLSDFKNS